MSDKIYNALFKLDDINQFTAVVDEMSIDELREMQARLKKKVADMVFDPNAVLKLSIVETKLERIEDGEIK